MVFFKKNFELLPSLIWYFLKCCRLLLVNAKTFIIKPTGDLYIIFYILEFIRVDPVYVEKLGLPAIVLQPEHVYIHTYT